MSLLESFEALLLKEGQRARFINAVAGDLLQVVFRQIPCATLPIAPAYSGLDKERPGYSLYTFSSGRVFGLYSSSGDHVIVLHLDIHRETAKATSAIASAIAKIQAA
jgi:hypothetical protein